ncbi:MULTISPECIES: ABC transporter substrate-binding protein [Alteromonas]|jgi:sorbitol/mannitol transport system substrate-binding protein|uniref:Sugar ABC transporter substrate-binding protein n=1 Tax=Alteromonas stellipolaris TaxID=233316 RepID=A0AAW7Z5U4_9ALTE|nr:MULTISPECIES: sugar ABC transporter substrate-binding protein [Alteromonas]AMJ91874.1 sugar ABC transporter substrate-binding protein [Alteromonas sp. Mac2]ALM89268.1 Various polyols ABC transporter, periplasmic substrate-binding protein [Alteromonas stellipolaris LMG 21856]AMJ75587.1 sugar ABC transporter substrate-binding protein [Alteromonas stellipolaris]AMJ88011.1 sugar ABC transporter substrate-binding protein [Alteromonas sp. Mac1]AMJ95706.1 sugar ABC transporter substrate-binding pr
MLKKLSLMLAGAMTMSAAVNAETITIATVNNGDMIAMKELSSDFEAKNPGIDLKWVTLEENILRQRVTTDVATGGGQYDVMTIGTYEVPIWGNQGWLEELDGLGADYDVEDLLPAIRSGLSVDNKLYAAPFYGESSMVMYRTDLMAKAGLEMPKAPTWKFIREAAKAMTDKDAGVYGICLRGKAGWGENIALLTSMSNSFGARWFDENWKPQFDSKAWKDTLEYYVDVMDKYGPPGSSANGFNENLALFQTGKCGIWIDATVAGGFVTNEKDSEVADKVGFALAPDNGLGKRGNWLWAWTLAIPSSSKKSDAAMKFISWATSKEYSALVAEKKGWANVPPGTRASLYENPEYMNAAPFAQITLDSINSADPKNPTVEPVPYVGVQFVAIPEFQGIGTAVGQQFSAALTGRMTVDQALQSSQRLVERAMRKARYPK